VQVRLDAGRAALRAVFALRVGRVMFNVKWPGRCLPGHSCFLRELLVVVGLFYILEAVAAEEVGEILREGCAGHDRVASCLDCLCF
jgi:hypothetical protein